MISETAIESLEDLRAAGLKPTDRDVIRLNALGLKLEATIKKNAMHAIDYLPRVAQISPSLAFRQPTIGHEIWTDKVSRFINRADRQTVLAVQAFALSRPASALPDGDSPLAVQRAIEDFAADCVDITREQLDAALDYVVYGANPSSGEYPAAGESEREPDGSEREDWKRCVSAGFLYDRKVILTGFTVEELEGMTREQIDDVYIRALEYSDRLKSYDDRVSDIRADYYATVAEIRERLTKEQTNG